MMLKLSLVTTPVERGGLGDFFRNASSLLRHPPSFNIPIASLGCHSPRTSETILTNRIALRSRITILEEEARST